MANRRLRCLGKRLRPAGLPLRGSFTLIAYFLQPWSLPALFNLAGPELTDHPVDIRDLFPGQADQLLERLAGARVVAEQRSILEAFIEQSMRRTDWEAPHLTFAADRIAGKFDRDILVRVRRELHLSERTFQRQFKHAIGVSPEQYRRITQFDLAFRALNEGKFTTLTDLAFSHRYADQSHYNRTFKSFTGLTPGEYLNYGKT